MEVRRFSPKQQLLIAGAIGATAFAVSFLMLHLRGSGDGDFNWAVVGARDIIHGKSPYHDPALAFGNQYPFSAPLYYPIPALVFALPFSWLPAFLAGAVFVGLSSFLLAYGALREGTRYLPLFLSAPFFVALYVAQWSPLLMASAFLPWLLPLWIVKPNIGLPIAATFASRRAIACSLTIVFVSMSLIPSWTYDWLRNLLSMPHHEPAIVTFPGILVLLAAFAWRWRNSRILLLLAIVPQLLFFYDQLPLWLVPTTWRQGCALTFVSWVGYFGWAASQGSGFLNAPPFAAAPWVIVCLYLPALALVPWQQRSSIKASISAGKGRLRDAL